MGKVDRLRKKVEPFAALFWALGIVLPTPDHARRSGITPLPSLSLSLLVRFLTKTRLLPPFSYLGMLFIYAVALPDVETLTNMCIFLFESFCVHQKV